MWLVCLQWQGVERMLHPQMAHAAKGLQICGKVKKKSGEIVSFQ